MAPKRGGSSTETAYSSRKPKTANGGFTRQQRLDLTIVKIQEGSRLFGHCFRWAVIAFIVYITMRTAQQFAGKATWTLFQFLADDGFSKAIAYLFGAGGAGLALRERKLRRRDTKQLGTRNKELETFIDPGRTSSKLNSQGDYREDS